MQSTHRGGENHLADLGSDLETNHVQGGRQLRVEVQGEVTERRQAEQRYLDGVEQLDDGDGDRVMEHTAQTDTGEHHGGAEQQGVTHADLLHDDRDDAHHGGLKEHLEGVQGAVGGVADFGGREQGGVVVREHLLIEHGVEGVGEQHEDDEHPQGRHLQDGDHFLEGRVGRSRVRIGLLLEFFLLLGRNPEGVDAQHAEAADGTNPEVQHRVDVEQEACAQRHDGVAEGAPGSGLAVFETEFTGVAFGDGFEQGAAGHETRGQHDGADKHADEAGGAAGGQHRCVHELHERANACSDRGDEDHELTLNAQLVLNGAVNEHDDQGGQGVDGVDLALLRRAHAQTVGRVSEPAGEEGPPDAPGTEEHENAEGALQIGRILPYRTCVACHFDSLFLFAMPLPRGSDRFRCCFGLRLL